MEEKKDSAVSKWLQRFEKPDRREQKEAEIANMQRSDYHILLEEIEHR